MNESAGESAPDWDYLNPELMREGFAYVAVSAQAVGVNGGTPILGSAAGRHERRPGRLRAGPVRDPPPSGRSVRQRHVRPDRQGPPRPEAGRARRSAPQARRRGGRVPVGLLPDHLRRCLPTPDRHLRRHLHPQPGWRPRSPQRVVHHLGPASVERPDPHRPQGPRLHVRDPDRPDHAGLRPRPAAEHRPDPDLGGGGHLPRRRLRGGSGARAARVHHPGQRRAPAPRGPGGLRRLQPLGGRRRAPAEPSPVPAVQHRPGDPGPRRHGNVIGG